MQEQPILIVEDDGRLGLAIVSEIMRIHGGRLDLQRRQGGGTRAELVMPL